MLLAPSLSLILGAKLELFTGFRVFVITGVIHPQRKCGETLVR